MSDARTLLREKRTEARISHPLAQYTASGQLRCIACESIVKQSTQWAGHVGSKAHRVSVSRMRQRQQEEEERMTLKRKAAELEDGGEAGEEREAGGTDMGVSKRRRGDVHSTQAQNGGGFPADFFSDPSQAPVLLPQDDDDDNDDAMDAESTGLATAAPAIPHAAGAPPPTKSIVDIEFEQFQKEIAATVTSTSTNEDKQDMFHRATVFAEPVMASEVPEGFPPTTSTSSSSSVDALKSILKKSTHSSSTQPQSEALPTEDEDEEKKRQAEEELKRKQKELDERELIMDRLMEEERAQEEADDKVRVLKDRVEAFKKRRKTALASAKS